MCKLRLKKMNWFVKILTFGWASAITLAPFAIYFNKRTWNYQNDHINEWNRIVNHESIHWKQQLEMLIIPFYLWYFIEWIIKIFIYGKKAYVNLSFEREAYDNDDNLDYLKTRKHYAWVKYISK